MKRPLSLRRCCTFLGAGLLVFQASLAPGSAAEEEERHEEHKEGAEEHEEGVVELTPEALAAAGIRLEAAALRTFTRTVRATGEIRLNPDRVARVGPRIAGRLAALRVKLGERVEAGAVLAELDSVELGRAKSDFLGRKAKLGLARSNHEREKRLQSKGISSEKELLEADAGQVEAQVELDSAEAALHVLGLSEPEIKGLISGEHDLSSFVLRAPIAGQVIEREAALGQMAEPSTTLFVVADLSEVWAQVNIHQKDLAAVVSGSTVTLRLEALPDEPIQAKLQSIAAVLDEKTRTAGAFAVLKNPDGRLKPGMFLTAQIETVSKAGVEALAVPETAVQRIEGKEMVFVEEGERRFEARPVRLGRVSGGFAEILGGLEPGIKVVTEGSFILKSELSKGEMGEGHSH